jgi:hypothetical protein
MPSPAIVEHLDVLKQALFSFLFRVVALVINQLCFQRTEEALSDRVIQALAFPTHTANESMLLQ